MVSVWKRHFLAAIGESHQYDSNGREKGTGWSEWPWAVSGVEVSEVLAEHWMQSGSLSLPLPVTEAISLLGFFFVCVFVCLFVVLFSWEECKFLMVLHFQ